MKVQILNQLDRAKKLTDIEISYSLANDCEDYINKLRDVKAEIEKTILFVEMVL